jgi:DNA-binding transcriptional LysR family regulator
MSSHNQIDLNLIRVFLAVLETGNTTRAGETLGLSQSAVSHALNRLRDLCGDPLFLRTPTRMAPTPRAAAMEPELREALRRIEAAFGPPDFDPARSDMRFVIALSDWAAAFQMPRLIEHFRDHSYPLGLELRPISELNLADEFDRGALHLAVGVFRGAPARFVVEPITQYEAVWVMRRGHPATKAPFTLETLARYPHLDLRLGPGEDGLGRDFAARNAATLDRLLDDLGLSRRIGAVTGHVLAMAPLLARSDMLGFMLKPMADDLADRYGLTYCAPPYPLAPMTIGMMSHRTLGAHPAVVWLRRLILDYACTEDATDAPA